MMLKRVVTTYDMKFYGPCMPKNFKGNPAKYLDQIGPKLLKLVLLQMKSAEMLRVLWARYLCDCKRHGVKPIFPEDQKEPEA